MWTCPRCDRTFGARRAHVCEPGMPVEVWLAEQQDGQARAAEAVLRVARKAGAVIEAVSVGVLIKRARTIVELRPKQRWLQLTFVSTARIDSPRISRELAMPGATLYYVRLRDAGDVDAELRRWLAKALRG